MAATLRGHFDGNKIVVDDNVTLVAGQQVLVTILDKHDLEEKIARKEKIHNALLRLSGALAGMNITEEEIRDERLKKYETTD